MINENTLVQDGKTKRMDMSGSAVGDEDAPEHLFLRWLFNNMHIIFTIDQYSNQVWQIWKGGLGRKVTEPLNGAFLDIGDIDYSQSPQILLDMI